MDLDLFNILTKIIYSIKFISYKNMILQTHNHITYIRQKNLKTKHIPALSRAGQYLVLFKA